MPMATPEILLSTLNARYLHTAFGLRYLMANLGELQSRADLVEFDINQKPIDIADAILARQPRILGLGVYIWNVTATTELVGILKRIRPELLIVIGGPEVSYETDSQEIVRLADYTIKGEADLAFADLCRQLLGGQTPASRVMAAPLPDLAKVAMPYPLYTEEDLASRVLYVEASRGCPFTCEFCLSSIDLPVRQFPLDRFLSAMQGLLDRGARRFKFVDRTFNLHLPTSTAILRFFLERWIPGMFVHFELVPDRLPTALRELIRQFPPGGLQFEVGVQSLNPEVEQLIRRRQDHARLEDNFRWLRAETGVHIHADLIAGLPGESLESFASGFDRLLGLGPQEIQVGILKRLRGTPIIRHDAEWAMVYSPHPPSEVLKTRLLDAATLSRLRRFAAFWDLYGNSGHFATSLALLWQDGSPFEGFLRFADWLHGCRVKTSGIARERQYELFLDYLKLQPGFDSTRVLEQMLSDYHRTGHRGEPHWSRRAEVDTTSDVERPVRSPAPQASALPDRQARHLGVRRD